MSRMSDSSIDLVVTSPPYDNLRAYNDSVDLSWGAGVWEPILADLARVIKDGGVIVWIVNDATIDGSETGTSFRQALYAMDRGLRLHDTMIWEKGSFQAGGLNVRYAQTIEYMFIFSKGKPRTFNPIKDRKNKHYGRSIIKPRVRLSSGEMRAQKGYILPAKYGVRKCLWEIPALSSSKERTGHPAQMNAQLAHDHIISWSNEGEIVYDPFAGSGTTCAVAAQFGRRYIGSEISKEYADMARARVIGYTGEGVFKPAEDLDLFKWREQHD